MGHVLSQVSWKMLTLMFNVVCLERTNAKNRRLWYCPGKMSVVGPNRLVNRWKIGGCWITVSIQKVQKIEKSMNGVILKIRFWSVVQRSRSVGTLHLLGAIVSKNWIDNQWVTKSCWIFLIFFLKESQKL